MTENFMPRVNGKAFRCDCQCNVFHKDEPMAGAEVFICNGCGTRWLAAHAQPSNVARTASLALGGNAPGDSFPDEAEGHAARRDDGLALRSTAGREPGALVWSYSAWEIRDGRPEDYAIVCAGHVVGHVYAHDVAEVIVNALNAARAAGEPDERSEEASEAARRAREIVMRCAHDPDDYDNMACSTCIAAALVAPAPPVDRSRPEPPT